MQLEFDKRSIKFFLVLQNFQNTYTFWNTLKTTVKHAESERKKKYMHESNNSHCPTCNTLNKTTKRKLSSMAEQSRAELSWADRSSLIRRNSVRFGICHQLPSPSTPARMLNFYCFYHNPNKTHQLSLFLLTINAFVIGTASPLPLETSTSLPHKIMAESPSLGDLWLYAIMANYSSKGPQMKQFPGPKRYKTKIITYLTTLSGITPNSCIKYWRIWKANKILNPYALFFYSPRLNCNCGCYASFSWLAEMRRELRFLSPF